MHTFLYIFLGSLDCIAVFVLIFKIFRWPIKYYRVEILSSAVIISFISYLDRMVLDIPGWDMTLQFIAYIALLMSLFRVSLPHAINLSAIGYLAFVGIQFIIYPLLLAVGFVTINDAQELTGVGTYTIQITSEVACYLVAFLIWKFNFGFSHVSVPPHDRFTIFRIKGSKFAYLSNIAGVLAVCSTMYWVLNFVNGQYVVMISVWAALMILLYLSHRRDYGM